MEWSGRAPAPPAISWSGAPRQGARHVSETQCCGCCDRHRYRQEFVPHRVPRSTRRHRVAAEVVTPAASTILHASANATASRAWAMPRPISSGATKAKGGGGPQPTSVLVVFVFPVADLTTNLSRRESIRVDVYIDRVALHGGEQRVESGLTPRESLTGERQDHRGRDASSHGSRRTRAYRSGDRHGRRGGIVRRLAQPHVDRARGVLLTEVEVRLIDELRTDDRRSGSVGELVGQLIGDCADLLVDLEREFAVPGTEDGADCERRWMHLVESREVGPEACVVLR